MQFRVLGALEVRRGDDLVDIGSSNERKIVAALLVDANGVVSNRPGTRGRRQRSPATRIRGPGRFHQHQGFPLPHAGQD
jgi:hypothetical protein